MTTVVTLNVGGCLFQTSKTTLEKEKYFSCLVSQHCTDEILFIDRDPTFFKYILNWMRGSYALPEDKLSLLELYYEADFFSIINLKEEVETKLKSSTTYMDALNKINENLLYMNTN